MIKRQCESRGATLVAGGEQVCGPRVVKNSYVILTCPAPLLTCSHLPEKLFSPHNPGHLEPSVEIYCVLC